MLDNFNPQMIQDVAGARKAVVLLLNIVEELKQENIAQRAEIQRLRDENNRLKGEQGKPDIKPNKKSPSDHSSEKERREKRSPVKRKKRKKIAEVTINREEVVKVDQTQLPEDAEFKGYETVIVQDLQIKTDNICFHKEKYYSAAEKKTYTAELPKGYQGQFGPTVRALVISLYYAGGMSEPKIIELIEQMGVNISDGKISNLLTKETRAWQEEVDEIIIAGLSSGSWQHYDDTGTRVNGVNGYCHILCNPFYTVYATHRKKDRLTVSRCAAKQRKSGYAIQWANRRMAEQVWSSSLGAKTDCRMAARQIIRRTGSRGVAVGRIIQAAQSAAASAYLRSGSVDGLLRAREVSGNPHFSQRRCSSIPSLD